MENFFNYISKSVTEEEYELWFQSNNIIVERLQVFQDFIISLVFMINDTYLGDKPESKETNIILSNDDNINHFNWCWEKIIKNSAKENVLIEVNGEHKDFIQDFIFEIFYTQKSNMVKDSVLKFFMDVFYLEGTTTKSDLDLITTICMMNYCKVKFKNLSAIKNFILILSAFALLYSSCKKDINTLAVGFINPDCVITGSFMSEVYDVYGLN